MNASRGHFRFTAGGRESFQVQTQDRIREELLQKHQHELDASNFFRRWPLLWQIEREVRRRAVLEKPSKDALFIKAG